MYRMPTEAVNTLPTGEIDYEHFRMRLRANQNKPAIVNVNIGTTVKGAVDDLDRVLEVLTEEGFDEDRFYIHCDGALFGLMVSHAVLQHAALCQHVIVTVGLALHHSSTYARDKHFIWECMLFCGLCCHACFSCFPLPTPHNWHHSAALCASVQIPFVKQAPMVTFKKLIGSVSVSGHKFVGAPVPCGVVITRKEYVEALSSDVEYLNSRDATIMGSRNGHAPLYLWYTLTKKGYEGMRKDVEKCLRNAHLLKVRLMPP